MKKHKLGLVVGKFCPLHKGHEFLIKTAISNCEHVVIISYTSENFEHCSTDERLKWLNAIFPYCSVIVADKCADRPDDSDDAMKHRVFCANLLNDRDFVPDVVFTSESYGDDFAKTLSIYFGLNVKHVLVDIDRKHFPISGTSMRNNFQKEFASPQVINSFKKKAVFLGGESSGKTTLAKALAAKHNCSFIPEYGRTLYDEKGGNLVYSDMLKIAKRQVEMENECTDSFLMCDTSPLTTYFYSLELFGKANEELIDLAFNHKYDHYFLCENDFPFIQDGTRKDTAFRTKGYNFYFNQLIVQGIHFKFINGLLEERIALVERLLINN